MYEMVLNTSLKGIEKFLKNIQDTAHHQVSILFLSWKVSKIPRAAS